MALPRGYKLLEYIQSSGTQYINTGIIQTGNVKVVGKVVVTSTPTKNAWVFGSRNENLTSRFELIYISGSSAFRFYCGTSNYTFAGVGIGELNYEISPSLAVLNGVSVTPSLYSFVTSAPIFICSSNMGASETISQKVFQHQIYDNGTLVRDYIPCQTTSGEIGLWDDVNSVFYGNAGTGTLIAGPEVGPSTPANFRLVSSTDGTATLAWDAVDGATGYKLYRDGSLIATLTDTSYTDTIKLFTSYVYALTACNDRDESDPVTLNVKIIHQNPILFLVTDRTAADVESGNEKGTYNASDLNRVGAAMNYVADRLRAAGYDPHISPKTDWKDGDWVDRAAQAVYLGDLAELRKQFTMLESTPRVPPRVLATAINSGDGLTYGWANDIEQILMDIDALLTNISAGWFYSGELYAGEV